MDKVFQVQKNARDNAKTFQTYMTDLQNWEAEMKRKEAALKGELEQDLPPVRSKIKKEPPVKVPKKPEKRISSFDYKAWDKFDVDKACEDVEMAEVGPVSLDGKKSLSAKEEKLREEAQYEKERGNNFVKQEKWDEAIKCYNRAIELVKDDAIYFANRGLCYLKKDSLHQAETDCTEALRLDPTYVKALQRRATARERLASLRAASRDLQEVLKLEPHNNAARNQLKAITARMGTKGSKSKSSPTTTPTIENKPLINSKPSQPKIVELPDEPRARERPSEDAWREGTGENITVIKTVKKPPHLRSKRQLKTVPIQEIPLGKTSPEKPPTRLKIIEIEDNLAHGDSNNNDSNKIDETPEKINTQGDGDLINPDKVSEVTCPGSKVAKVTSPESKVAKVTSPGSDKVAKVTSPESEKLGVSELVTEKDVRIDKLVPPVNSVQFMAEWKGLRGHEEARSHYLSIIDPKKIPSIFANALESDVLSDVIRLLASNPERYKKQTVTAYLTGLCSVKRFSALAMFLSSQDKELLTTLLDHCKKVENCTDSDIADLKNKYEL